MRLFLMDRFHRVIEKNENRRLAQTLLSKHCCTNVKYPKAEARYLNKRQEEQFLSKVEIKIKIPDELKPRLVDDWQNIVFNKKLVKLPAQISADDIIDAYLKQKVPFKSVTPNKECARVAVTKGIKEYFNVMLGPQLLYTQERDQFNQLVEDNPDEPISSLYSGIHLLRLFVRLGRALAYTRLDEKSVQLMLTVVHDFLKFLHRKADTYLSPEFYAPAASD